MQPHLVFRRRGQLLMQVMLPDAGGTVGSAGALVTVLDPGVAPIQAELLPEDGGWRLFDRSGKGTLVDGSPCESVTVGEGTRIAFGACEATFTFKPIAAPPRPDSETAPATQIDRGLPLELVLVAEIPGQPGSRREARFGRGQVEMEIGLRVGAPGLTLPAEGVSKRHAKLTRQLNWVTLHDLGSTNGTWCATGRIYEIGLGLGARFTIEPYELWLEEPRGRGERREASARAQLGGMITADAAMKRVFVEIKRVAPRPIAAIIHGESGTGKELVAQAIHDLSERRKGPFVKRNCANFTGDTVESMLFGHKRGAFTGAVGDQRGAFQTAHGGTLFLDEVVEMPLPVQAKLLRTLESGEVYPMGSDVPVIVDVRVVAASHRALINEVQAGRLRADLFYRLNCVLIELPPLRDREGDVRLLWDELMERKRPLDAPVTSPAALAKLLAHRWPGNIRELHTVLERALIRIDDRKTIEEGDIVLDEPPAAPDLGALVDTRDKSLDEIEKAVLVAVMRAVKGNLHAAARQLAIGRNTLKRMLEKHGLKRGEEE